MTVSELRDALDNLITNQNKGDAEVLVADTSGMEDIYLVTDLELRNVKNYKGDMVDVLVIS